MQLGQRCLRKSICGGAKWGHAGGVQVQDLHAVTPAAMLEVAGCCVHALSYQQARNHRTPTGQVIVFASTNPLGAVHVSLQACCMVN